MTRELQGVIPITVTPFDAAGRVDEASIASLVEFEARCGVHGLTVRRRGAIATSVVRQPGPTLDDVTRRELGHLLARLGLAGR